jgi:hypothetical protein
MRQVRVVKPRSRSKSRSRDEADEIDLRTPSGRLLPY